MSLWRPEVQSAHAALILIKHSGFSAACLSSADLDWLPVLIDDDDDDDDD